MSDLSPQQQWPSTRTYFALWIFSLAMAFGVGWWLALQSQHYHSLQTAWAKERRDFIEQTQLERERILSLIKPVLGKQGSRQQLEQLINGGRPFSILAEGNRQIANWAHDRYQFGLKFQFSGDQLAGYSTTDGNVSHPLMNWQVPVWPGSGRSESLRRLIVLFGIGLWLLASAAWYFFSRTRIVTAQFSLLAAIAASMAWLVNPGYSITWQGIIRNDSLGIGAIMIFMSAYLLGVTFAECPRLAYSLLRFKFGLRYLLAFVTVVATLLAVGPFGYVTLLAGISIAIVVVAIFSFYRVAV